jgi:hypothetical protein
VASSEFAPERVPALYRHVLDALDRLEHGPSRREAVALRRQAIEAYSRGWDLQGWRRLLQIEERARQLALDLAGPSGPGEDPGGAPWGSGGTEAA